MSLLSDESKVILAGSLYLISGVILIWYGNAFKRVRYFSIALAASSTSLLLLSF